MPDAVPREGRLGRVRYMPSYRRESWIDPRLELGASPIHGEGVRAREPIALGEVVIIWGGVVMTEDDIRAGRAKPRTAAEIGEGVFLAGEHSDPDSVDDFLNHSCDSHLWFDDEVTLSVRRELAAGDEVTVDYALWGTDTEFPCTCGSPVCRGALRADDWRLPDVRRRYQDHFQPYINARLERMA
jgi:SET domain-containing protein